MSAAGRQTFGDEVPVQMSSCILGEFRFDMKHFSGSGVEHLMGHVFNRR